MSAPGRPGALSLCVELTTARGDLLILDCGTGAHRLAAELMAQGKDPIHANTLDLHLVPRDPREGQAVAFVSHVHNRETCSRRSSR